MADGQVVFEINGDSKGINQTVRQVTSNIQSESKKWDQATGEATGTIEKQFASMAGSIVGKLTAAGIGAVLLNWGKAAVDAASDLAEVQNVVDTVFGDGAATIESWAKTAGEKFGLTETMAKKFTSTLGAMMKSSGLAGNEIVDMSTSLAGLAADMASFYNLDFETAFEKIRSGISGETMPLKQLGINMSVANLEAFALAQGLEKTFSEMDQGEQTMLRYQYLMQSTSDAQGDFEKTSDGFANARRRIQASIESIQTSLGTILLPWIERATSGLAGLLESMTATPERTVLDDFKDIDADTSEKLADLQETYNKASDIIKVIDEIQSKTVTLKDGSTITFEELFKDLGNVEKNGGDVRGYLETLGVDVEEVIQRYNMWKEATRQLTSTVPSLAAVINNETGEINTNTDALQANLDEWKAAQEKKIAWAAYYAKKQALAESEGSVWQYRLDSMGKEQAKKRIRADLEEIGAVFDEAGNIDTSDAWWDPSKVAEDFDIDDFLDMADKYAKAVQEDKEATTKYTNAVNANAKAHQELEDIEAGLIETYGEEEQAVDEVTEAVVELSSEQKKAGKAALASAESALKALADYVQGVRDSTAQSVNSVVKGFEKVGNAGDELRTKQEKLGKEYADATKEYSTEIKALKKTFGDNWLEQVNNIDKNSDAWKKLSDKQKEAYNTLARLKNEQYEVNEALDQYKPAGMMKNLESQMQFMENYLANLQKAQEWGLSPEMLASLADGSKESAEYLAGLVEAGPEAAKEVSALYDEVQAQKKSFTDALADQKLAADETYDSLVQKAIEAIDELNLGDEAEQAMADTVGGLAQGIADKVGDVQAAVDAIEEQLNRLDNLGLSFNIGGFNVDFVGNLFHPHETGLDFVPYDGYLASLHEGEGILTAEENRIWQRFVNGGSANRNVDYDTLGSVMRDNVHAGGDVYLDGRTVGRVVSDMQGNQYRSLQRSGWQQ